MLLCIIVLCLKYLYLVTTIITCKGARHQIHHSNDKGNIQLRHLAKKTQTAMQRRTQTNTDGFFVRDLAGSFNMATRYGRAAGTTIIFKNNKLSTTAGHAMSREC